MSAVRRRVKRVEDTGIGLQYRLGESIQRIKQLEETVRDLQAEGGPSPTTRDTPNASRERTSSATTNSIDGARSGQLVVKATGTSPSQYKRIGDAVAAAVPGDRVLLVNALSISIDCCCL